MAFTLARMDVGQTPPIEYKPVTESETVTLGEALVLSGGKLTKCGATSRPGFVAVGPADADGMVPVIRVQDYMEFETALGVAPEESATVAVGDKVTLNTDGLQITATTNSGVATVTYIDGQTVGSLARVRF